MDNLTPTLNQQQLQENITALQKGGVGNDVVQKYVDNYKLDSPGSYSLKAPAAPPPMSPFNPKAPNSQAVDTTQPAKSPGAGAFFLGSIGTGVKQTAANLAAPIKGGINEVKTDTSQAFKSGVSQIKEGAGDINSGKNPFEATLKMGAGAVGAAFSPLAAPFKPLSSAAEYTGNKLAEVPAVQKFANTKAGAFTSRAAEDVANLSTIAQGVGGFMGGPEATAKGESGLSKVAEAAKPGMEAVKNDITAGAGKVADAAGAVKNAAQEHYVKVAADQWAKPSTVPGTKFSKAADIFNSATEKGHNIGETLARNNLNPSDHVENGLYTTADTADKIRTDTGKLSSELLRPSLQKADAYTPKTSVSDIIKSSIDNIKNNKGLTQETKDLITKKLNQTASSLQKQYPEGMSLTDLHDEKITRDANAKYSPVGDIGTNNEAIKNKAVADAARTTLETKAPPDVPVKDFNAELSKQYKAASYLDALNGKKAPVGKLSKLANYGGKITGLAVGHAVGGGILSDVVGYHLGGMVERMFEGMSNPLKSHFLDNLKTSNPEAFTKIQDYLAKPGPEPVEPSVTTHQVIKPADLTETSRYNAVKNPKTGAIDVTRKPSAFGMIKVNNYLSKFPKYFSPDQIASAGKMLDAMQQAGKTIDMKAVNEVVKRVKPMEDIKPSIKVMNKAKGAFSAKAK